MRSLKDSIHGAVDLSVVLMIGIAFAGLVVIAFLIWEVRDVLIGTNTTGDGAQWARLNTSLGNITTGFDNAVNLLLVAITIFILAIAISALLMLRGR